MIVKAWQYAEDHADIAQPIRGQDLAQGAVAPYWHLICSDRLIGRGFTADLLGDLANYVELALAVSQPASARCMSEDVSPDGD